MVRRQGRLWRPGGLTMATTLTPEPAQHARYSPSALTRIAACPGSLALIEKLPPELRSSPDTPASIQGTRRHLLLAEEFQGLLGNRVPAYDTYPLGDQQAVNQILPYLKQHAALARPPMGFDGEFTWSEQQVEIGRWLGVGLQEGEFWGTADLILCTRDTLEIADAKFGQRLIDPDCLQLKAYALGAGALLVDPQTGEFWQPLRTVRNLKLTILQPTAPQVVRSVVKPLDALSEIREELGAIVRATQAPDAPLNPGDHCHFCPAATSCPARLAAAEQATTTMFEVLKMPTAAPSPAAPADSASPLLSQVESLTQVDPVSLDVDQLARVLDLAPIVRQLFKDLEARATKLLKDGGDLPGWKLVEGRRGREWTLTEEAALVRALGACGLSAKEIWKKELESPAALDKVVQAKGNKAKLTKFAELWAWKAGSPVLAPAADPRPGLRDAEAMFPEPEPQQPEPQQPEPQQPEPQQLDFNDLL